MNRVNLVVLAAHRKVKHKDRKKILISNFIRGLYDNHLALQISTISPTTAAEAEQIATLSNALREKQLARRAARGFAEHDSNDPETAT